ncbi:MAG: 23S rRNA (uracil(1939)-C(5))-methyltransferase RlmD [Lentisphaeria bacterium]|nr:23S rRNA (uracil(1939)-C(5))-methyltransferase RlmD [Lentisphaeria bacterium]
MSDLLCEHFGECGGCRYQDTSYQLQVDAKKHNLETMFSEVWKADIPVQTSPEIWSYRNKIELKFDREQFPDPPPEGTPRKTVLGFRKKGCWYWTLDLKECKIFAPELEQLLPAIRAFYKQKELNFYDQRCKQGDLCHLILRKSRHTSDWLLILITRPGVTLGQDFVDAILEVAPQMSSIYQGITSSESDVALSEELIHLYGKEQMDEALYVPDGEQTRELKFRISPHGFFQVNILATEKLYGAIRAAVKKSNQSFIYDLYGGAGGIAFAVADLAEKILSVENFAPASEDGRKNAVLNGIENVRFETADVTKWTGQRKLLKDMDTEATVIVDPPRAGLNAKVTRRFREIGPKRIIYVSCNPKVMARELPDLMDKYEIESIEAFDLFPHTDHVECLAVLNRK